MGKTPLKITFYDILFSSFRTWWESTFAQKSIVAQRTLSDIRDGKNYTIRKLADGNCWMTSNLALELTDASGSPKTVIASKNDKTTFKWTPGACGTNAACAINGNTAYSSSTHNYYYSWYAATAEIGTESDSNKDIDGGICPKGWKIPSNYTVSPKKSYPSITGVYYGLTESNYKGNYASKLKVYPLDFLQSGTMYGAIANSAWPSWWTSTASPNGARTVYSFNYDVSYIRPQSGGNPGEYGFSIRCVAL